MGRITDGSVKRGKEKCVVLKKWKAQQKLCCSMEVGKVDVFEC